MPDVSSLESKMKSFWEKPEGKTGMVFMAALIGGAGVLLYKLLPYLITLAQNTIHLAILVGIILAAGYIIMDPKFRATVWYLYRTGMKKLTGLIIEIDPIAILKTYLRSLYDNLQDMNKQIGSLKGQIKNLTQIISDNEAQIRNNMALAQEAKKQAKNAALVTIKTRKAGRLNDSNMTYKTLLTKMEVIYRVLSKMYDNCSILYEDTQDQIKQKEIEWNVIRTSYKAIKAAMNVINGNTDKKEIFEQTLEYMATDLGNKIGEMERFMEVSQGFMDGIDLQNGVFEEKGLEMLEKWEKDADSLILGDDKGTILKDSYDDSNVLNVDSIPTKGKNEYSDIFKS